MEEQERVYKITLHNGTTYENVSCAVSRSGYLHCYINEVLNLAEVFSAFSNAENTQTITYDTGEEVYTYEGYTEVMEIRKSPDGEIAVVLGKGGGET